MATFAEKLEMRSFNTCKSSATSAAVGEDDVSGLKLRRGQHDIWGFSCALLVTPFVLFVVLGEKMQKTPEMSGEGRPRPYRRNTPPDACRDRSTLPEQAQEGSLER